MDKLALKQQFNDAVTRLDAVKTMYDEAKASGAPAERMDELNAKLTAAITEGEILEERPTVAEARERARAQHRMVPSSQGAGFVQIKVNEPDTYEKGGRSFFHDLYAAQVRDDPSARARIDMHHRYEVEKRATTTATLGGIIPPAYLVELYAKASRNGRVFADQCNQQQLPDVGMSVVVPRLTQGLAAGFQATESTALSTQDPTETDLTVNVRTIGGYLPVSRQGIERAAYSDQILFEDLVARYWAALDSSAINGAGSSGTFLGLLNTSSISTSSTSTATVAAVWPKIADVIQQINTAVGGMGYLADKVFFHPRRWA
jgi:HK97 family phage major capsid protein